ncbi:MAG: 50S ribosomal protein L24, partial [Clostridia bacterium]|nr:50S ribosomal protein L24 [Clostridia bacterium]
MRPKLHVRRGDTVVVIRGKNAGKKGKVIAVDPERRRVVVEGVNIVKRHTKPSRKV